MGKLTELREKLSQVVKEMKELSEKESLSEEESARFDELDKEASQFETDIEAEIKAEEEKIARAEKLRKREEELAKPIQTLERPTVRIDAGESKEFNNLGEFIHAVANAMVYHESAFDRRLEELRAEQSMGEGTAGGFMVPTQFRPTLLQVTPQEAIVRPRATVIPAGTPPDAEITMPVLNQGAAENIYGGIVVEAVKEGGTKTQMDWHLKEFTLTPHEVAGWVLLTDKLIRNWPAASAFTETQMRKAIIGWEDDKFLTGSGVGIPKGVYYSGAVISHPRATASLIATADVIAMYSKMKFGGSLVWVTSQTTLPQLMILQDAASQYIWAASAVPGLPPTLYGIPVLFNERSPALGSFGDLALLDLSYYMIKDGSGPFVAASPHVYFTSNRTVIKIFWNVDGDAWLDEPLPLEGATSSTVSPFVVLDVP